MNALSPILHFGVTRRNHPALVAGDCTITYGELAGRVRRTATHLQGLGCMRGDRIGICLKDSPDHVVALLAVAHVGGVAVSLDWRARPNENARFIDALGLAYVLVEPDSRLPASYRAFAIDADWHQAVARAAMSDASPSEWHDPFAISATSGSTGLPKFTVMTHLQYHFAIAGMFELMGLTGTHRFLCTLPFYYSGGRNSCLAHLLRGDCVVLYPSLFSPAEYFHLVYREEITVGALVPSVVRQLLAACAEGPDAGPRLARLTKLFCTGAPLHPQEKREAARRLTPNFNERYGTAETLAISVLRPEDFAERAESVGQPHSFAEVEIVDENDRPLAAGEVGNLRFRGPGLGSPLSADTGDKQFRNGCFYPGEIARMDEAGFIFLHGRVSDVIMRSGAKIYPAEVESALFEHPLVGEAAVLGHAGEDHEETVVAFVVAKGALTHGELLAHCRARLTPHKVPRQIHMVAQLPKNTAGKVDKPALANLLAQQSKPQQA